MDRSPYPAVRWLKRSSRGQSILEFALSAPVLLILLLGLVEFGHALNSYLNTVAAARDGARLGARLGTDDVPAADNSIRVMVGAQTDLLTEAGRAWLDTGVDCSSPGGGVCIQRQDAGGESKIDVRVCYDHYTFVGLPGLSGPIRMCSATTMRIPHVN